MDQDWELKYVSESPKRGLYTTIYIDIQLKNAKTQGQVKYMCLETGDTWKELIYMPIYTDIRSMYTKTGLA
uniref:Uncharacterized protein n=1 Tax=Solanum tuberosum TaxID=4113 RepID=M1A2R9_SOLTU